MSDEIITVFVFFICKISMKESHQVNETHCLFFYTYYKRKKKTELVHAMCLKAGHVCGHYLRDDYKIILNLQVSQNKSLKTNIEVWNILKL